MMNTLAFDPPAHLMRCGLGLLIGMALGFAARRGRFCTLGAIEDAVYAADTRRLRAWAMAVAVAMAGVACLRLAGLDLSRSIHADNRLEIGPLVVGGVMFGIGMALAGNCAFGSLLRLGGGDLKALVVVLVLAISAEATMRGPTAMLRVAIIDPVAVTLPGGRSQLLPDLAGLGPAMGFGFALACAVTLTGLAFSGVSFRRDRKLAVAAFVIGLCVAGGWWATGLVGHDPFGTERPLSFSFARPLGDTVLYGMLASGLKIDFAVGSVLGVLLGGFVEAVQAGEFRWEAPDDARELRRHVLGAFLMGTGGVTALGCTIGQGVTGLSVLSIGSVIAVGALALGARIGLFLLIERTARSGPAKERRWRGYLFSRPKFEPSSSRKTR